MKSQTVGAFAAGARPAVTATPGASLVAKQSKLPTNSDRGQRSSQGLSTTGGAALETVAEGTPPPTIESGASGGSHHSWKGSRDALGEGDWVGDCVWVTVCEGVWDGVRLGLGRCDALCVGEPKKKSSAMRRARGV